ncbi:MAG: response regulator, partial [Chloroflexi bacterium]|nr:response regulator [Chloroflexota bacterium]
VLKQAVICLLSEILKHLSGGSEVIIHPYPENHESAIRFSVLAQAGSAPDLCDKLAQHPTINSLVDTIGAELTFQVEVSSPQQIVLHLPYHQRTLLVIDDNPDVIALIERYVAQSQYTVVGSLEAQQGINLAHRLSPFVIMLDVMMPGADGWEVLQHLKTQPATRHIPVLICSVLDTPELAFSLGADFFLKKPPGRVELLRILGQMVG